MGAANAAVSSCSAERRSTVDRRSPTLRARTGRPLRQNARYRVVIGEHGMNLVDRIKGMLVEPRSEWVTVAAEPATAQSLYTGWIMILAAVGPIALLVAMNSIQFALAQYVLSLITTFVLAVIVDALAPTFGGTKDFVASLKLVAYSYTAAWLSGVFLLLGTLGYLLTLVATIYAFYTFVLGAPVLGK